jgi:hypothetical protein
MTAQSRRALVPEDRDRNGNAKRAMATSFVRAATASLIAANNKHMVPREQIAAKVWPDDRNVGLVIRTATAPADTVTPGWAGAMTNVGAVADLLSVLAPAYAGPALLARCLSLQWPNGVSGLSVPTLDTSPNYARWVGQGQPFPVMDFVSSRVTVNPKKIGAIATFSREIFNYSTPAIEALVRLAISESLGLAIDQRLFSNSAADAVSPPGILGAALGASNDPIPSECMASDVAEIIATVSSVAGNSSIVLIASPRQAAGLRVRTDIDFPTLSSSALPDKSIAAVATNALFSVGDSAPQFEASLEAVYHAEGSTPAPIVPQGSSQISSPVVSAWQQDIVALKVRFSINWALRNSAGAAWITGTSW